MKKTINQRNSTEAVSPVIAVMLMLVVTIIIAAVVSAFAGGLASEQKKTPTASMDVKITNSGMSAGSSISFVVRGVSEPIPTKDVKIVTSWTAKDGTTGGATILPWSADTTPNTHHFYRVGGNWSYQDYQAPLGTGPGINGSQTYGYPIYATALDQNFGNYTLDIGTGMSAYPIAVGTGGYGKDGVTNTWSKSSRFLYADGTYWHSATDTDSISAVLGKGWNQTRSGDIVNVRLIYIPTGGTIFEKDVAVVIPYGDTL